MFRHWESPAEDSTLCRLGREASVQKSTSRAVSLWGTPQNDPTPPGNQKPSLTPTYSYGATRPGIPSYDLADKLAGRAEAIWAARKQKLATANAQRRARSEKEGFARSQSSEETWAEDRATRGRHPSADPGAKTGEGGTMPPCLSLSGLVRNRKIDVSQPHDRNSLSLNPENSISR
jgi:hypothetical protein